MDCSLGGLELCVHDDFVFLSQVNVPPESVQQYKNKIHRITLLLVTRALLHMF